MAYADIKRSELAALLDYSESTIDRMTGRRNTAARETDWRDLWKIADACDVPREWFTADIERLHEIVPEGMPTFVRQSRSDAQERLGRRQRAQAERTRARRDKKPAASPDRDARERPS